MATSSAHDHPDSRSAERAEPSTVTSSAGGGTTSLPMASPSTAQQTFAGLTTSPTRIFGPYRIIAELARGGMGIVYHAEDTRLGREVALKVLRAGVLARSEELERFNREARAIAKLNHPNIVPLYDVGDCDGQLYFTMELARAGSLSVHRPRLQGDRRAAVTLLAKVARALAQIHAQGLLHRDLKPANILMRDDETPLISDFGLAKLVGVDTDLTRTGAAVGTPSYMAPEHAAIQPHRIGPATDIWSLGVIGYELICGAKPFSNSDERRLIDAIIADPPVAPRKARPGVDRDLETILLKCLEKEPGQRYASAAALADDLEAWLANQPIKARPAGLLRRAGRWARRHYIGAAVLALLAMTAAALPLTLPEPDLAADPVIQAMQAELAHLRPVTLIDTSAERPSSRWIGSGNFQTAPEDGALQVVAKDRTLLLLLPDPVVRAYRFEGELRVDSQPPGTATAGLFVGHSAHDTADGRVYSQVAATMHHINDAPVEVQPRFVLSQYFANAAKDGVDQSTGPGIAARKPARDGWYHIAIDVNARGDMRMMIDHDAVAILAHAERLNLASTIGTSRRKKAAVNESVPPFAPRGSLGLYLDRGTFSFRNVRITPHGG